MPIQLPGLPRCLLLVALALVAGSHPAPAQAPAQAPGADGGAGAAASGAQPTMPGTPETPGKAAYVASCTSGGGEDKPVRCACVADKIEATFEGRQLEFAWHSATKSVAELGKVKSGLSEAEEDAVIDKTFKLMTDCGIAP